MCVTHTQIQLDAQRKALDQLQANVRVLEGKLGEARNKRETLKARAASAKSSKQIQEVSERVWLGFWGRAGGAAVQCVANGDRLVECVSWYTTLLTTGARYPCKVCKMHKQLRCESHPPPPPVAHAC